MVDCNANRIAGTYGSITFGATNHNIILGITGRNYDTTGFLNVSTAHVRLPLNEAVRLHAALADLIAAADASDERQPALWGDATITQPVTDPRRYGWRAA